MIGIHSISWWPTVAVLAVATITDLRNRRIPNWLTLPFLVAGLVAQVAMHGWSGAGQSLAGIALGAVIFGVLAAMGGMGMGDLKLCAAIGAWVGPSQLMIALVFTGLAGGAFALAWALCGGFLGELLRGSGQLLLGGTQRGDLSLSNPRARKMPYAPAIALGTLLSFFAH